MTKETISDNPPVQNIKKINSVQETTPVSDDEVQVSTESTNEKLDKNSQTDFKFSLENIQSIDKNNLDHEEQQNSTNELLNDVRVNNPDIKNQVLKDRNSKEERRFQVGSISTEKHFPNTSKLSLLKLFDSPSAASPKISEDLGQTFQPQPSNLLNPKLAESHRKHTFGTKKDKEVLIGTPVKEGHANYILMYDMLTGIRISVKL